MTIEELRKYYEDSLDELRKEISEKLNNLKDVIDNAPTVEPTLSDEQNEERPHGEWVELKTNPPLLDHKFYICSLCNREIDVILPEGSLNDYPFCHCGAKMEVEQ